MRRSRGVWAAPRWPNSCNQLLRRVRCSCPWGSAMKIPLTKGKFAIIDDVDWPLVRDYSWHARYTPKSGTWYADTNISIGGKQKTTAMHQVLLDAQPAVSYTHLTL